jgi:hypothetical protein
MYVRVEREPSGMYVACADRGKPDAPRFHPGETFEEGGLGSEAAGWVFTILTIVGMAVGTQSNENSLFGFIIIGVGAVTWWRRKRPHVWKLKYEARREGRE